MAALARLFRIVDAVIAMLGKLAAMAVLGIIGAIVLEMGMRGGFGRSQPWANEVASWLLAVMIFLGGPWALASGNLVRVDVLYDRFGHRTRALIDTFVTTTLFLLLLGVLLRHGWTFFVRAYAIGETSATGAWDGPVWLAKGLIPLGAALMTLAWASHLFHAWTARDADRPDARP